MAEAAISLSILASEHTASRVRIDRFNQYLQAVGSDRQVWSFGAELADGVAWCTLLNAIDPAACPPPDDLDDAANVSNVINAVHKMGVKVSG